MNLGGYNYSYILNYPRIREKTFGSGLFLNIILAFFIVIASAFLLNNFQNYLKDKSSFNYSSGPESIEKAVKQGYIKIDNYYLEGTVIETAKVNWLHKLLGIKTVYAASAPLYEASLLTNNCRIVNIAPNKALTCEVSLKNTGSRAWYNYGSNYISFYVDSLGRIFRHKYWHTSEQPAKLLETKILPGQVGHLRFALQAPELVGFYRIKLKLAAENLTWISGGILEIPINVSLDNSFANSASPVENISTETVGNAGSDFQALKFIQSHNSTINLNLGEKIIFRVGFKNTGRAVWQTSGDGKVKICLSPLGRQSFFKDSSWPDANCPAVVSSEVAPGQIGYFNFTLQGSADGDYKENFALMTGSQTISGGELTVPIIVSSSQPVSETLNLESEPNIRIGLYSTLEPVALRANTTFEVRDSESNLIFVVPAGATIYASYNFGTKQYSVNLNGERRDNLSYLKFISQDPNTVFEIVNYSNPPSWNTSLNDNKFRGNLELRYSEGREKLYVINELPLEVYLKGIAESANNNPIEYHKALVIAARTYAKYNINIGGKHPAAYFHLNASAYDQVYRGYNSEMRLPNWVRAVLETRGLMVTYNNEVVVTPYFSQSDGRTRAWEEVWSGGPKPWLVSRPDPYCVGMSLWGHGVGFSARGAHGMALAGSNFEQILKHYYTGIELKKIY